MAYHPRWENSTGKGIELRMRFSQSIARRFMLGGKGSGPSRLTGWIAIIGLAVGCMAMILSVSILNGFESRVVNRIIGFEGDIRVSRLTDWDGSIQEIQSIDGVKSVMSFQERKGLILGREDSQRMVLLKAVDSEMISSFYELNMLKGDKSSDLPQVFLGEMTARRLNLNLGDGLRIMSPIDHGSSWGIPRQIQCVVGGIFNIQVLDLDDKIAFIPTNVGQKLFIRKEGPDGVDIRLTEKGREVGLVDDLRWQRFNEKMENIELERQRLRSTWVQKDHQHIDQINALLKNPMSKEASLEDLIRRPEVNYDDLMDIEGLGPALADKQASEQVEIQTKYAGYIDRQLDEIAKKKRNEDTKIPAEFDYQQISGLSNEVVAKLKDARPETIGKASRISGITPAAISLLLVYLKKHGLLRKLG